MSNVPKYKIIQRENQKIVFFPQSMDIISIKPEDFEKITHEQLITCYENFLKRYHQKMQEKSPNLINGKIILSKIMLDLTDDCLLNCKYCYAAKYRQKKHMSKETIDKIITKFFMSEEIASVNRLVFFGGEPLLNLAGMEYFINRMEELLDKGKISKTPDFNIITSGTIYSQRISKLFKKYKMGILVSIDGPQELQNEQRPFRGTNNGSWDIVSRNIRRMIADKQNISFECTVTKHTLELGYSHKKLKNFFLEEFGLKTGSFVPEMTSIPEKAFSYYPNFYEKKNLYFQALIELNSRDEMFEVPYRLIMKRPLGCACGLGSSTFHILANGDIYPCQLIAGMEQYKITNIVSFNDSYFHKNNWIDRYKENSYKCNLCWAKPLCKFCPARQLIESNSYTLPEKACIERRELLEDLILKIIDLRNDPNQWEIFTQHLEEKSKIIKENIYI